MFPSHFTDEETESRRSLFMCLESQSARVKFKPITWFQNKLFYLPKGGWELGEKGRREEGRKGGLRTSLLQSGKEGKMKGDSCPGSGRSSHLQSFSPTSLSCPGTVLVPAMLRSWSASCCPRLKMEDEELGIKGVFQAGYKADSLYPQARVDWWEFLWVGQEGSPNPNVIKQEKCLFLSFSSTTPGKETHVVHGALSRGKI